MRIASGSSYAALPRSRETLGAAIVLGQIYVLALCVARTVADLNRGSLRPEGGVALALALTVAVSLGRKMLRLTIRSVARFHYTSPWAASAVAPVIDLSSIRAGRGGKNGRTR
jgi:hypothetical protein